MENRKQFSLAASSLLIIQCILYFALNILAWHLKNDILTYLLMLCLLCVFVLSHLIGMKKIVVALISINIMVAIYFSYSPYTHYLINSLKILNEYNNTTKGHVYLVGFSDGSMASVVFSDNKWMCYGKEYSSSGACRQITSIIQGNPIKNRRN